MGKICPKHVELILEINKTVIVESRWFPYYLTYIDDARSNTNQIHEYVQNRYHACLFSATWIQHTPIYLVSSISAVILFFHLYLDLPKISQSKHHTRFFTFSSSSPYEPHAPHISFSCIWPHHYATIPFIFLHPQYPTIKDPRPIFFL